MVEGWGPPGIDVEAVIQQERTRAAEMVRKFIDKRMDLPEFTPLGALRELADSIESGE